MAVVVNDATAVAQLSRLQTNSRAPKRPQADAFRDDCARRELERPAAFSHDRAARGRIGIAVEADFVGAAKNAVVAAGNRVEERRIVAHDGVGLRDSSDDHDLSAMWFHFRIGHEDARPDSGAIDD